MPKALIVLAALAALLPSCGGDEGDGATGPTTATGTTAATGPTATAGPSEGCVDLTGEGPIFTITMAQIAFEPDCFIASGSQGISVVNEDPVLHSFTIVDTPIDVDIEGNETFNGEPLSGAVAPGTYDLICKYHAAMVGEVTIAE